MAMTWLLSFSSVSIGFIAWLASSAATPLMNQAVLEFIVRIIPLIIEFTLSSIIAPSAAKLSPISCATISPIMPPLKMTSLRNPASRPGSGNGFAGRASDQSGARSLSGLPP